MCVSGMLWLFFLAVVGNTVVLLGKYWCSFVDIQWLLHDLTWWYWNTVGCVVYYWNTVLSVCVSGMLCASYSSGQVNSNCVLSACCGLLLEYCRLCVTQACSVPSTPLLGWMLTVCFQLAVVYYWNTVVCVCLRHALCRLFLWWGGC